MNIKRAIGIGVLMYLGTFALGLLTGVLFKVSGMDATGDSASLWIAGILIGALISIFAAIWYFRAASVSVGIANGFLFGLIAVLTGFVLDMLTIFLTGGSVSEFVSGYYGKPFFWITVFVVLAATTLTGRILHIRQQLRQPDEENL